MGQRKVVYNKYIQPVFGSHACRQGTGEYETDYPNKGMFLEFGVGSKRDRHGHITTISVVLIELEDGTIEQHLPEHVKFVK